MFKYIFTLFLVAFSAISPYSWALANDTISDALREDLVMVEGENFVIDKNLNCQVSLPLSLGGGAPFNAFNVHVRFSAPAKGLISRDMFVALSMRIFTEARIRMASEIPGLSNEQSLQAMKCQEADISKTIDGYVLDVVMTHEGIESTIKNKRIGTENVTKEPWSAVLPTLPKEGKK